MAFSAHEVRVLRRALTVALRGGRDSVDFWLLGRAIGEAHDERERLRAFMTAELRRYRAALPGSAATFLACLRNAVDEIAHVPSAEDLAALRTVVDLPCGPRERASRAALLRRCTHLAEAALEQRLTARAHRRAAAEADRATRPDPLEILIPTRIRPSLNPPSWQSAPTRASRPQPPAEVPTATTVEPEPVEPEATECVATEPVEPAVTGSAAAEPAEPETAESRIPEPGVPAHEAPEPTSATLEAPAATASPPATAGAESAPSDEAFVPVPSPTPPDAEGPLRESVSPVIPHRRQGRALGQLPTPDILQTGTG
ncbi:hypothetical protein EHYA_04968 [Embleya hyalina]|uniref:Uncharacterized protein n=2 Tax=Embleya hyalina TaxID=516124 RepID=A0A401YRR8_9ACTN|nr:hypothetical protein EHYA_04968 [Embleya hyalina]